MSYNQIGVKTLRWASRESPCVLNISCNGGSHHHGNSQQFRIACKYWLYCAGPRAGRGRLRNRAWVSFINNGNHMWHHSQQGGSWPLISSYWIDVTECSGVKTGEDTAERESGRGWEGEGGKKCPDAYELTNVCFGCWEWSSIVGLKKHQNTIQGWHPVGGGEGRRLTVYPGCKHCTVAKLLV